ncbi:MAG: hypothetical protein Q4F17_02595 [Eubacteriales bacterium]|nr:hypothetical protein [Eubacteriales bacterium]
MKFKRFAMVLGAVLVILGASVYFYWDALVMYAAPQVPLKAALGTVFDALEQRYQDSPVPVLFRGYQADGLNSVQVELSQDGAVKGRLEAQVDLEGNRLSFRGTLPEAQRLGSVSMYLDRERVALTSDTLLQGGYYGITYDTFRQDLGEIPLVSLLAPEALISQWEDSLKDIQQKMDWSVELPQLPEISMDDLKTATLALWALRGRTSVQNLRVDGQQRPCWKVAYALDGEPARLLWEKALNTPMPQDGQIRFAFYLWENALVRLELEAGETLACALDLGPDAREDDLNLTVRTDGLTRSLGLQTRQGRDTLLLDGTAYSWDWNRTAGDLTLLLPGKEPLPMTLTAAPEGFCLQSDYLWRRLRENPVQDYTCTLTVTKGTQFRTPEYKNLNAWSLDDLLTFLNGAWTLLLPQEG